MKFSPHHSQQKNLMASYDSNSYIKQEMKHELKMQREREIDALQQEHQQRALDMAKSFGLSHNGKDPVSSSIMKKSLIARNLVIEN